MLCYVMLCYVMLCRNIYAQAKYCLKVICIGRTCLTAVYLISNVDRVQEIKHVVGVDEDVDDEAQER